MIGADCDQVLLVQAEFDGELDAAEAARLAVHRAGCPVCQAATADLEQSRALMSRELRQAAPERLRARLAAQLGATRPPRPLLARRQWWPAAGGFGLGAACAAALLLAVWVPRDEGIAGQIVAGHIRALQPGHLEDVESTDRHTVKPWFDGRIDFAPPVKDLAAERFPLRGGRLDYLADRPVAALVYQRDKHLINLFVWPAADKNATAAFESGQRQGYNFVHWQQDGMALWAVSDVSVDQLQDFAESWRRAP